MALPSFLVSAFVALPVLTCPACWPLYAGLLSALGLGFIDYTPFLLPGTVTLLVIALVPLAWKAWQRWGYKPFALGFIGAVVILSGKFWLQNQPVYYAGIVVLLIASIWNVWPYRNKEGCSRCISENA